MSAKERKRKSTKERKREQKGANERNRALPRKNRKPLGLKQPGLGTPNYAVTLHSFRKIPAPIKIKSALPPQTPNTPPPQNEEFYGHGGFPAERKHFSRCP